MWGPPSAGASNSSHTASRSQSVGSRGAGSQAQQHTTAAQAVQHSPHAGIIPRAVAQVFSLIAQHEQAAQKQQQRAGEAEMSGLGSAFITGGAASSSTTTRWVVGVQFLEIHNEEVGKGTGRVSAQQV